jgi:hypothetical protein
MREIRRKTLVHIRTLRHLDGRLVGYGQCWADAGNDWHVVPGAEFDVELDETRDMRIRVLTAYQQPPHVPGAGVVPEIVAEEIAG